ncbi:MAG: hypothetical protein LV473_10275 [Nitrospira sp.]|nr:hypothetical protein [Nitrospira sp.]
MSRHGSAYAAWSTAGFHDGAPFPHGGTSMACVSDSRSELLRPAEELSNFHDVATIGNRRYLEHVRNHKLRSAVFGILFQQLFEYPLRLRSVLVKVVLLFPS